LHLTDEHSATNFASLRRGALVALAVNVPIPIAEYVTFSHHFYLFSRLMPNRLKFVLFKQLFDRPVPVQELQSPAAS
jgi:hypothetical protein